MRINYLGYLKTPVLVFWLPVRGKHCFRWKIQWWHYHFVSCSLGLCLYAKSGTRL